MQERPIATVSLHDIPLSRLFSAAQRHGNQIISRAYIRSHIMTGTVTMPIALAKRILPETLSLAEWRPIIDRRQRSNVHDSKASIGRGHYMLA
jgi:hypothetical protein